jgi:hypothetical protein
MQPVRFLLALGALAMAASTSAADPGQASWDKLKSLVGDWQGSYSDGTSATVSYRLVSSGTAVMETLESSDSSQMVSVYHRDGMSVLMTHYCSLGNQSRMRNNGLEGGKVAFAFVDATNVKAPDDHVMTGLVLSFPASDRLVHEWSSKTGAHQQTGRFEFVRRK